MALITPNFDELAELVPGTYSVSIVDCEVKESKKGAQYLKWKFETINCDKPANNGQSIWTNTMVSGRGAFRFVALYKAATGEVLGSGVEFDTEMLLGKEIKVGIEDGLDQQGNKSGYPEVKNFWPSV